MMPGPYNRKRSVDEVMRDQPTRHMPDVHATGTTIEARVFLYCPVGNIVSWSAGDVEHEYCAFCDMTFMEIQSQLLKGKR